MKGVTQFSNPAEEFAVSADAEYSYVTAQIHYHSDQVNNIFGQYIRLFSAIVGGSIWLRLQDGFEPEDGPAYGLLSNTLVVTMVLVSCLMVAEHIRAWYGYRKVQTELTGKKADGTFKVPLPKMRSALLEFVIIMAMVLTGVGFWWFNPFTI